MAANMQSSDTFQHLGSHSKKAEREAETVPAASRRAHSGLLPNQTQDNLSRHQSAAGARSPGPHGSTWVTWDLSPVRRGLRQLLEGFRLISRSGYLCHVCLHFVLHYIVSTFFYFEKTLVVASGGGTASQRVATFATINSMSAGAVALIQLTATV